MREIQRAKRVVIIAAHPDDEIIGAGLLLGSLREVYIVHTTDGSPLDLADARRSGFTTREAYAECRRSELARALTMAGVPVEHAISLGFTDQQTIHCLPGLCDALDKELRRLAPDAVVTQPYEGGHPDHDSTAFAVHRCWPKPFEMTSYHARDDVFTTGRFLSDKGESKQLTDANRARKQSMLACFASQSAVLQYFPMQEERFREAPAYDFTQPPHAGKLHYENLPWGITGAAWRLLAAQCP